VRRLLDAAVRGILCRLEEGRDLAVKSLELALKSFLSPSPPNYSQVVKAMAFRLYYLHREITEIAMEAVARYGPVAGDLRLMESAMFVSYSIYRIARYAFNIASAAEKLSERCESENVKRAGEMVIRAVSRAVDAFLRRDASVTQEVAEVDEETDRIDGSTLLEALKGADKCKVVEMLVMRLLERAADHAHHIAAYINYVATGERPRIS
jgi:phosphate transport system protein